MQLARFLVCLALAGCLCDALSVRLTPPPTASPARGDACADDGEPWCDVEHREGASTWFEEDIFEEDIFEGTWSIGFEEDIFEELFPHLCSPDLRTISSNGSWKDVLEGDIFEQMFPHFCVPRARDALARVPH